MWVENIRWASARHLLLAAGLLLVSPAGTAAVNANLKLVEAIDRTLVRNPELVTLGHELEAREGQVTQAQISPAPELGLLVENALGSGDYQGLDAAETTLSLGWVLERGKRERLVDAARAGISSLQAETNIARLDAAAGTARLFLDSLEYQQKLALAQTAAKHMQEIVDTLQERVKTGRTPPAELARARAELAGLQLAAEDMHHEMVTAHHRLSSQWGELRPDFQRVTGDWEQLPQPASFDELMARVQESPDLAHYLSRQRLREAELRLAEASARPDWRINAGIRRLELTDDHAFVAGITIPLTSSERNQGRVAEARAQLAKVDAERTAGQLQIETQLFDLYQALQHSLHRATTLSDDVLPLIEDALSQTRAGYEAGRYSYFELQRLQAELLNHRASLVEASIDARRFTLEIERLTGGLMPTAAPTP